MNTNTCPNCGHSWDAHSAYIARAERLCEEALEDGYLLRLNYTDQNMLWFADLYEGPLFAARKWGTRARAQCLAAKTKRVKADERR